MKYIIVDWMNNTMFNGQTFDDFEDAWEFIYQNIEDNDNDYDDVFVIPK